MAPFMTFEQLLVDPSKIESELENIWKKLAEEKKMRASIFNLICVTKLSPRTDYFRNIVQKVIEKFPCRVLFITEDPDATKNYLKTAVSVLFQKQDTEIACDLIDIGVAGKEIEKIPYLILPHFLPDLPIYLLWAEDPTKDHPLFLPLLKYANRVIFDSESADSLLTFSEKLLWIKHQMGGDVADLNWARTEGFRDLIVSAFDTKERVDALLNSSHIKIGYNAKETEFFGHLKIQAMYLLSWLSTRLGWSLKEVSQDLHFQFARKGGSVAAEIVSERWDNMGPGAVLFFEYLSQEGLSFEAKRDPTHPQSVTLQISTKEKCELPYHVVLAHTAVGHFLVKEICMKGTSPHFLESLEKIQEIDKEKLC